MSTITLRAHYDGQQIRLDDPFELETGTPLVVTVLPPSEEAEEREDWLKLSARGLAAAYGSDEPDYSAVAIREPNPEYERR